MAKVSTALAWLVDVISQQPEAHLIAYLKRASNLSFVMFKCDPKITTTTIHSSYKDVYQQNERFAWLSTIKSVRACQQMTECTQQLVVEQINQIDWIQNEFVTDKYASKVRIYSREFR